MIADSPAVYVALALELFTYASVATNDSIEVADKNANATRSTNKPIAPLFMLNFSESFCNLLV
tara:strand:- start:315 stop:503 length:189 start_codon:yes stop_codon:yes gene_type:complete